MTTKSKTSFTLITGASGGIGRALAEECAAHGHNLVLVARRGEVLEKLTVEISSKHRVKAIYLVCDLTGPKAASWLVKQLAEKGIAVDQLINNAGFGDLGRVIEADASRLKQMIALNITALTELSQLIGRQMAENHRGRIMNVASVAALVPGPGMAVYYASKAYVLSFSQALAEELKPSGVTVTTLCPGATNSDFAKNAHAEQSTLFSRPQNLPTAEQVAQFGYQHMQKGRLVAMWGVKNRFFSHILGLLPRRLVLKAVSRQQTLIH